MKLFSFSWGGWAARNCPRGFTRVRRGVGRERAPASLLSGPFRVANFPAFSWQLRSPPTCPPTSWTHKASPSSQQAVLVTVQAGGSLSPCLGGAPGLTQAASLEPVGVCPLGAPRVGGAASLP